MDACADCTSCRNSCPTGSILKDRPLIDAERCLCFLNEHPGDFPDWVHPSWHNSIVGCILCQEACPQNQGQSDPMTDLGEFTSDETELLLNQVPLESLSSALRSKLEKINMTVYYQCLSRNLRVLLDNSGCS